MSTKPRLRGAWLATACVTLGAFLGAGTAGAEPKPVFAFGGASVWDMQVNDEWGIHMGAARYFDLPGNQALDEAHASVSLMVCTPVESGCAFNSGYSCEPEGSPFGEFRLADPDDFTIDFYSLRTAVLKSTAFVCNDPDKTRLTVSVTWSGSGRLFLGPAPPSERFRETVVATGVVTGIGSEPFFFEQRTDLQSTLTSRFFREP